MFITLILNDKRNNNKKIKINDDKFNNNNETFLILKCKNFNQLMKSIMRIKHTVTVF